jgi:hypothetical protein|nr:nucleotidyltransferase [uncultured Moraxella sp.]
MAKNVVEAFNEFLKDKVNIDKSKSDTAKASRDWLINKINNFPQNDLSFPLLYEASHLNYGSFERKTKTRPLDDIDIMICLNADGWSYFENSVDDITLRPPSNYSGRLNAFKSTVQWQENNLSSTRILNRFIKNLNTISQYSKAEIKKNGVATVLKLTSYDWNFDIVPCFRTAVDYYDKSYYLIPNGNGNWKKTDPRVDRARLQSINQACNGKVLNVIRLFKFWNQIPYKSKLSSSYLLETMISNYYQEIINQGLQNDVTVYPDIEFIKVANYIIQNIYNVVSDPKNIDGNINIISYSEQLAVKIRLERDLEKSRNARILESNEKQEESIKLWREIFGEQFPNYG